LHYDTVSNKANQDVTGFEMGNTSARFDNEILAYNQSTNASYGVGENQCFSNHIPGKYF
jgi:hypothetical protein